MTAKLILLRHAERPDILSGVGNDVHLTERGIISSFGFGQSLNGKGKVVSIKTSPVLRCIQTAEQIAMAVSFSKHEIQFCRQLGDPGIFISDADLAWEHWQQFGSEKVNQYLLSGKSHWRGFRDLDEAANQMLSNMKEILEKASNNEIIIWVTHDTILATFVSRILPKRLTLEQWPNFLGHLVVSKNTNMSFNYFYQC